MQAYLSQNAAAVADWGHLEPVLGVFRKLLSSKANEAYAFNLLGTMVMNVSTFEYADTAVVAPVATSFKARVIQECSGGDTNFLIFLCTPTNIDVFSNTFLSLKEHESSMLRPGPNGKICFLLNFGPKLLGESGD